MIKTLKIYKMIFLIVLVCINLIAAVKNPESSINNDFMSNSENSDTNSLSSNIEVTNNIVESRSLYNKIEWNENLLKDEVPLMIREFQDIVKLYNKKPSNVQSKIKLYQNLLVRLNKMTVNTDFLIGQRDIMKNAIRYRLGINNKAESGLQEIIKTTQLREIKNDAMYVLISFYFVSGDISKINYILQSYTQYMDVDILAYVQLIQKVMNKIETEQEASYLFDEIILAPKSSFQHDNFVIHLLNSIQEKISTQNIDQAIKFSIYNENNQLALLLMRMQIKRIPVPYSTLVLWKKQIKHYSKDLYDTIRIYQQRSEDYQKFVKKYQDDINAKIRGKKFHNRLYVYRGMDKSPYNITQTELILKEYISGQLEEEYVEKNAKRAFRNFLAYQRYDLLVKYAQEIRDKLGNEDIPSYINFWESYALMRQGQTNKVIPLLGSIVAEYPESYYGIIAQKKLKYIFKQIPFSANKYFSSLKEKSVRSNKDLFNYMNILYYLGNRIGKSYAEKTFIQEGIIFIDAKSHISSEKLCLAKSYLSLGLTHNTRQLAYKDGIKNIYNQDVLLAQIYDDVDITKNGVKDLMSIRSRTLHLKNSYIVGKDALRIYFPTPYQNEMKQTLEESKRSMDPYLLYSVMRTESFYKEKATSRAGARGLMQIMPVTGKWLIDKYIPTMATYSLYTPKINIYLGSIYLYDNIMNIGMLPALAAYNSGPTYVKTLLKKYDPKTDLELVEIHPKQETRNYVKKVIESYKKYSLIYNNNKIETIYDLMS